MQLSTAPVASVTAMVWVGRSAGSGPNRPRGPPSANGAARPRPVVAVQPAAPVATPRSVHLDARKKGVSKIASNTGRTTLSERALEFACLCCLSWCYCRPTRGGRHDRRAVALPALLRITQLPSGMPPTRRCFAASDSSHSGSMTIE